RKGAVFARVGRKLMERKADGLGGGGVQLQLGAAQRNAGIQVVGKVGELGTNQIPQIDSPPRVADQQVLIGGERLQTLGESLDEPLRVVRGGLVRNGLHEREHVLGAMVHLAHQELNLLLGLLAVANVPKHENETVDRSVAVAHAAGG